MKTIDLNCDMGELKTGQDRNYDTEIMPFISSCNIACGFHSGTPQLMTQTIRAAIQHDVKIGAHPSYHDRENFGRKSLQVDPEALMADLLYQIYALKGMVENHGQRLHHVKPHGALYNDLLVNDTLAERFVNTVKTIDPALKIVTLANANIVAYCRTQGVGVIQEGFADRRYEQATQLRSRKYPDAVLHDPQEVLAQIAGFMKGEVSLANGKTAKIAVDTICLHSDTPGAVSLSQTIYHYLKEHDIKIIAPE
ncbi:5-oxoprolinase subunit PxpA [Lewinella sp. LCG006]|uniref:5-oxoprolinase subunit PxpA n=1 Tax=Lewinella sp. LCG006 TaxID=3231911 RepID=UPI00345FE339